MKNVFNNLQLDFDVALLTCNQFLSRIYMLMENSKSSTSTQPWKVSGTESYPSVRESAKLNCSSVSYLSYWKYKAINTKEKVLVYEIHVK